MMLKDLATRISISLFMVGAVGYCCGRMKVIEDSNEINN